ncbi:MAG: GNAT family N-acetyltransferase [Alphaproteobacteria bacterium]|nr:GNAT family N-acetyltransferase [Alphaproteobacteria bacterium]
MNQMVLEAATLADAESLARLHAASFTETWSIATFTRLLASPGGFGLMARVPGRAAPEGGILCQVAADQAEIFFFAVSGRGRRRGTGRRLLDGALAAAAGRGATHMLLEVAVNNAAALALYRRAGFVEVGRRAGYYQDVAGRPLAALVMRREIDPQALRMRSR